jgi:arsenate reductase
MSMPAAHTQPMSKLLILILCTGNSCRSQMAEYFLRDVVGDVADVASAGSDPAGYVHPLAIEVMQEKGHDLSDAVSKSCSEFLDRDIEVVITVCGNADQACPEFSGQKAHYCWRFADPADTMGNDDDKRIIFRRVRDEINLVFTAFGSGLVDGKRILV